MSTSEEPKQDTVKLIDPAAPTEPKTKEEYLAALRTWMHQANLGQNAMACFPYYMMQMYPQMFQPPAVTVNTVQNPNREEPRFGELFLRNTFLNRQPENNGLLDTAIIDQNGGFEFVIAPFWKRIAAEAVDAIILFLIKLVITFALVDFFDINIQNYIRTFDFDLDSLKSSLEEDYFEFVAMTSELLAIEMLAKVAVCVYEAIWTYKSINGIVGGATPGKLLFGIRIVHVTAVYALQEQPQLINFNRQIEMRALLYPAENPGFKRAIVRSFTKNLIMSVLFPMCFIMFFFKNHRTSYDLLAKTIVVEQNPTPILRRRPVPAQNN